MAKFRGDRPRDRGDLALKKKQKERKKQHQNIRARTLIATGGPNQLAVTDRGTLAMHQ